MHVHARVYWLPKSGNRRNEYEDAFAPARPSSSCTPPMRFAIGDGATETSFARLWARQLVRGWIRGTLDVDRLPTFLSQQQARWLRTVRSRPLPWYAEEKVRSGAYAAFLGLEISAPVGQADGYLRWRAVSVGDCCLFQLRDGQLHTTFPAKDVSFFTGRPYLLSSHPQKNGSLREHLLTVGGGVVVGDSFLLMTDALAACFFTQIELGSSTMQSMILADNLNQRRFRDWIDTLRRQGDLRNDDVTLYSIEVLG